jgi:ribonuclease-3
MPRMNAAPWRSAADLVHAHLGHTFGNVRLLELALTHSSSGDHAWNARIRTLRCNERLEYLGDAVLGAAVAAALYRRFPEASEGALSKTKAQLISRTRLAAWIAAIPEFMSHVKLGDQMALPMPESVQANIVEALLGAIFLDGDWKAFEAAVERLYGEDLNHLNEHAASDAKSRLQAWAHKHYQCLPEYDSKRSGGSDHAPQFSSTVLLKEHSATGEGTSRQRAETAAAGLLLNALSTPEIQAPTPSDEIPQRIPL